MKYECHKEVFEMNLGITKENVNKIGDLVSYFYFSKNSIKY